MTSTAEKTTKTTAPATKQAARSSFFHPMGEASFFRTPQPDAFFQPSIQTKPAAPAIQTPAVIANAPVMRPQEAPIPESGGSALPAEAREFFQSSYQADVQDIRIHTDGEAAAVCRMRGRQAFTHDRHIFLDSSRYAPGSEEGSMLIAQQVSESFSQRSMSLPGLLSQLTRARQPETAVPAKKQVSDTHPALVADKKKPGAKKADPKAPKKTSEATPKGKKKKADSDGPPVKVVKPDPKKSPGSPDEDPAFQKVVGKAKATARTEKHHDPAATKATDAQKAAPAAPKEAESKAQEKKTGHLDEAGKADKPFDEAGFRADLLHKIESVTPQTLEEATEFKENNRIGEVKGVMGSKMAQEKASATGPVTQASATPLQVDEADNKKPVPLPPTPQGAVPAGPAAKDAAPKPKLPAETSLAAQSTSLDASMKENGVSEEQLAGSNEPSFQSALEEKKGAQKDAADRPLQYKKDETKFLTQAGEGAQAEGVKAAAVMHAARGRNAGQVVQDQQATKQSDLSRRAGVAKNIEAKYAVVEAAVTKSLDEAESQSARLFDEGAAAARQLFEDYVEQKVSEYKRKRYSGFWGKLRWGKDKLFGMPDAVNAFYTQGRQLYIDKMDQVISQVAHLVTGKLNEAKAAITTGRKAIDEYVQKLPKDLQDVGKEAADSIQDKFDSLEQSVNDRRDQMIEGLAKKYVDNVKQLDERISDMKEANKGLVDKAIGLLRKVYQVIRVLTNLFMSIFSKLAKIIGVVLSDPGRFFDNIGKAFSLGFANFKKNFTGYLEQGLMDWLMTNLGISGVELPKRFDAASLFGFALQVLGITKTHIRERAVVVIGARKVAMLEAGGELLARVYSEGIGVIWEMISDKISDFREIVWEAIKSFIQTKVVEAALTFILSMLNPIGAFVKVCMAIYDFLMMLVRFKDRITELLDTILNAVISLASGAVDSAAKAIEGAFAKSIPVIIGFLAALLHLNDIAAKVRDIITRIRTRVEKGIDWVLKKAVTLVKGAGSAVAGAGRSVAAAVKSGLGALLGIKKGFTAGKASHTLYFAGNDSKVSLMVATTPKELPIAISDREQEIRARISIVQKRSSKNAAAEVKKQERFLGLLHQATIDHGEIERSKVQITQTKEEPVKAKLQRDIFKLTDKILSALEVAGVTEADFGLEIVAPPVAVGDKILSNKQYYRVTEILPKESRFKAGPININTGEPLKGAAGLSSAFFLFEDYQSKFSMAGENVQNLSDAKLDLLNYLDGKAPPFRRSWNSYEGEANKVLNHRAHNFQRNPAGHQWEHLLEQASPFSVQVINSVENMYLAKQSDNHTLGRIFGEYDLARDHLTYGSDAGFLDELVSNGHLSPREYLRSKSIDEHRKWKLHFYKKLGISPVSSDRNIDNRGPFRTMNNATV